mgnify:CR=1 FL=1
MNITANSVFNYTVKTNVENLSDRELFDRAKFITDELKLKLNPITANNSQLRGQIVKMFLDKGIMERRGKYVMVKPVPLSIKLSVKWWEETPASDIRSILQVFEVY